MRRIFTLAFAALVASIPLSLGALAVSPASACACAGDEWSAEAPVFNGPQLTDEMHSVTIGSVVYAVWTQPATSDTTSTIRTASTSDAGATWTTPEVVSTTGHSPIIIASSEAKPVIFYVEDQGAGRSSIKTYEWMTSSGHTWGAASLVASDQDSLDEFESVTAAALPGGDLAVAWTSRLTPTDPANTVDGRVRHGGSWSAPGSFLPALAANHAYQNIELTSGTLVGGDPTLVFSWAQSDLVTMFSAKYAQSPIPRDGGLWQWAGSHTLSTSNAGNVHTEAVPSGGFVFGWGEYDFDTGTSWVRFAGSYNAEGGPVSLTSNDYWSESLIDSPRFRVGPNGWLVSEHETTSWGDGGFEIPVLNITQFDASSTFVTGTSTTAHVTTTTRDLAGLNTAFDRPWPSVSSDGAWILPFVEQTDTGEELYVLQGLNGIKPGARPQPIASTTTTNHEIGWGQTAALPSGKGVMMWVDFPAQNSDSGVLMSAGRSTPMVAFSPAPWSAPVRTGPHLEGLLGKVQKFGYDFQVASTSTGFVAAWSQNVPSGERIAAATSIDGVTWSSPTWVSDTMAFTREVDVSTNPSGDRVFVSWTVGSFTSSGQVEIPTVAVSGNSGATWNAPITMSEKHSSSPTVTSTSSLTAVAEISSFWDDTVAISTTTDGGTTWTPLTSPPSTMATAARFLADGTLAVAYAQLVSAYQWDVVQARKSPSGTLTETSRTRVSTGSIQTLKIQASPRNAADIVVSWNTVEPGFQGEAYTVQRSSDFGATWVTPVTLSLPGHSIWGDNIEWNSTGDLVLVGESHEDATSLSTVISTRLLRNSNAWSTPREISESDFDSYGKTEVSADGTMVSLIWRRNKIDAYSDTFAVLFIVSRDGGATWSSPQPVVDPEQDIDRWTSRLSVDPRSNIWTLEYLPADETTFLSTTLTLSTPTPPHVRPPVTTPTTDGSTASSSRDSGQSLNTSAPEPSPLPGATGTPDSTPTADPGLEAEPPTGTGGGFNPTLPLIVFIGMIGLAALAASAVWLVRFMRR